MKIDRLERRGDKLEPNPVLVDETKKHVASDEKEGDDLPPEDSPIGNWKQQQGR